MEVAREEQFTCAVAIGELCNGAYRSQNREHHVSNIEKSVLPAVTVLPYDIAIAKVFGSTRAHLETQGMILPDADIQIAATAIGHDLELVTGNLRHFNLIPGLKPNKALVNSRAR